MAYPEKRGAKLARWLAARQMQEDEARMAEAMRRAAVHGMPRLLPPPPFEASYAPFPDAPPQSLEIGTPRMISANARRALGANSFDSTAAEAEKERAAQAASALTAIIANEGIGDERVRLRYKAYVDDINSDDKAKRAAAKLSMRTRTPPLSRQYIYNVRPDVDAPKGSGGTANRTNASWNNAAKIVGKIGRASAVTNAAINSARIATSDEPVETAAKVAGGIGGALAGAEAGAVLGAPGGLWGIGIGGALGGLAGGFLGEEAVEGLFELGDTQSTPVDYRTAHKRGPHRRKQNGGPRR